MARPYWSGQLKISLVSFGVKLFPATNPASEVSFHQVDRKTGQRVHHRNVTEDGKTVEQADIVKGYEYSKGKYLEVDPEEIARLRIKGRDTLELSQFVDLGDLPPDLFTQAYYVAPAKEDQPAAFAVVRAALAETGKAGLGEIAAAGREHLIAIAAPKEKNALGLMAYTLRYGDQIRSSSTYFSAIKNVPIDKKQLAMAAELIRQYSAPLDLNIFKDDYESALRKLIEAKKKNAPLPLADEKPKRAKVIDLMDALRRSVEQTKASGAARRSSAQSSARGAGGTAAKNRRRKKAA